MIQEAPVETVSKPAQSQNNTQAQTKPQAQSKPETQSKSSGKELYVTATAYSHEESRTGLTATGINIKTNSPHEINCS